MCWWQLRHACVTILQRSHGEKSHKSHHHSHSRSRSRKRREAEAETEHREQRHRDKRRDHRDHEDQEQRGTWHGRQRHPSRRARETALRPDTCHDDQGMMATNCKHCNIAAKYWQYFSSADHSWLCRQFGAPQVQIEGITDELITNMNL